MYHAVLNIMPVANIIQGRSRFLVISVKKNSGIANITFFFMPILHIAFLELCWVRKQDTLR